MAQPVDLVEATDAHFAWMLGEAPAPPGAPALPGRGLAPPERIGLLRGVAMVARAGQADRAVAWFLLRGGTACGLLSYKAAPADGVVEIGYGVAPSWQGRGIASAGVAQAVRLARRDGLRALTAETAVDNVASRRVLERNAFRRTGERSDPEDGALIQWRIDLVA